MTTSANYSALGARVVVSVGLDSLSKADKRALFSDLLRHDDVSSGKLTTKQEQEFGKLLNLRCNWAKTQ